MRSFLGGICSVIKFIFGAIAIVGLVGIAIGLLIGMAVAL